MGLFKVGQTVQHPDGKQGIIKYVGALDGKPGVFVGVELDEPLGKNDGAVDGKYYFKTQPNHGIFYRDSSPLDILAEPQPQDDATNGKPVGQASRSRPSSVSAAATARTRQSISGASAKRASITPASGQASTSSAASKRHSMAPPATAATNRTSRQSLAARSLSPQKPAARHSMVGAKAVASPGAQRPGASLTTRTPARPPSLAATRPSPTSQEPPLLSPRAVFRAAPTGEADAKAKQLERARSENKDMAKELEQSKEMMQRYETINDKLQAKCKAQHDEVGRLSKELGETAERCEQLEKITAEHDTLMELAALDREMAEEKEDATRAELDAVKGQCEELKLEYEILKADNEELAKDMSPEERANQGWLQMERERERLKEALIRLRELTRERETELMDQIEVLEQDNEELSAVKSQYEETKVKVLESEAQVEDLREQLEVAENAEVMIEQLTERNSTLSERVEELRNEVEDLQSLKEVSDETEQQYNEYIKQLEELINAKEMAVSEAGRRSAAQREDLDERDYTIARFRELVTNMQSDLEDMRASKKITETEALELGNHTRSMMDLNRQLQASATSARLKTIDSELRKMDAQEASEHLTIVQLFLPDAVQTERDSILALLRFRRIGFKSRLLHGFVRENVTSAGAHVQPENVLAGCEALDKLTWISAVCDRFTNAISSSSLEQFSKFESTLYELEPVERTLNSYIESLKKDELHERMLVESLQRYVSARICVKFEELMMTRSIAVLTHLSDLHLRDGLESYAEEILMKTLMMQSNLENTAAILSSTKNELLKAIPPSSEENGETEHFVQQSDLFASQTRSAKVISSKVVKSLQEYKARSLSLNLDTKPLFDTCSQISEGLVIGLRTLGFAIFDRIHEEGQIVEVDAADISSILRTFNSATFNIASDDVWTPLLGQLRSLHEHLSELYGASTDLSMTLEFERPETPWVLKSKAIAASKFVSVDTEAQINHLKREIHERATALKLRDQALEDANLKAETLAARMRDTGKKVNRINELESTVVQQKDQAAKATRESEELLQRIARLEEERDGLLRESQKLQSVELAPTDGKRAVDFVGTSAEMDALREEVKVLESTTRYLRQQIRRIRAEDDAKKTSWLSTPLRPSNITDGTESRIATMAALEKLTLLPATAKPIIISGPQEKKLSWQPMATTPQWQLSKQELSWFKSWGTKPKLQDSTMFWVDAVEHIKTSGGPIIAVG